MRACSWIPLPVLLMCAACASSANRSDAITTVETIERLVSVPVPCSEVVERVSDVLDLIPEGISTEQKIHRLAQSDSRLRGYIARLEASALACGVRIE